MKSKTKKKSFLTVKPYKIKVVNTKDEDDPEWVKEKLRVANENLKKRRLPE